MKVLGVLTGKLMKRLGDATESMNVRLPMPLNVSYRLYFDLAGEHGSVYWCHLVFAGQNSTCLLREASTGVGCGPTQRLMESTDRKSNSHGSLPVDRASSRCLWSVALRLLFVNRWQVFGCHYWFGMVQVVSLNCRLIIVCPRNVDQSRFSFPSQLRLSDLCRATLHEVSWKQNTLAGEERRGIEDREWKLLNHEYIERASRVSCRLHPISA